MLRGIGVLVDPLGDHLTEARLLGEPFASEAADRVPSDLDGARLDVHLGLGDGHHVRLVPKPRGALQRHFALGEVLLSGVIMSVFVDQMRSAILVLVRER